MHINSSSLQINLVYVPIMFLITLKIKFHINQIIVEPI